VVVVVAKARLVQVEITARHNRAMVALATNGLMVITTLRVAVAVTGQHLPQQVVVVLAEVVVAVCAEAVLLVLVVVALEIQAVMVWLALLAVAVTLAAVLAVQILVLAVAVMGKANICLTQELVERVVLE
jgi:hypothetical protein